MAPASSRARDDHAALELAADLGADDRRAGTVDDHAGQPRPGGVAGEPGTVAGTKRGLARSARPAADRRVRGLELAPDEQSDHERDHARTGEQEPAPGPDLSGVAGAGGGSASASPGRQVVPRCLR
ncbi:MAG: hypothetical protein WKG01_31275 [Kofleriaceae bacterium]